MTAGRTVRPPAVAGLFYPDDPGRLHDTLDALMADAMARVGGEAGTVAVAAKAVIAPHAGYVYSGPIAASAYARLAPGRRTITRVVLLGPAHRVAVAGLATSSADAWATPLGEVRIDVGARDDVVCLPSVVVDDRAHRDEHSLEVHLPFVQSVLGDVAILPLVTGLVPAEMIADVLEQVWGGPETAVIVSTDLSHYHDRRTAAQLDEATAQAIVARQPERVGTDRACGASAVRGLLVAVGRRQLDVNLLDLRSSADTAGPLDRVVGYGSFAIWERQPGPTGFTDDFRHSDETPTPTTAGLTDLTPAEGDVLLDLAEQAIRAGLGASDRASGAGRSPVPPALLRPSGVFVTLEVAGALNGCIGTIDPVEPLAQAVPRLAAGAAFDDPRLPRLTRRDWPELTIKISLLSLLAPLPAGTEADVINGLRRGVDGLVLAQGEGQPGQSRTTFLPTMWRTLPEPVGFVRQLLHKAGIQPGTWPAGMMAWTYTTTELCRSLSPG